jgi:prepilin-type N-terminal cleavage/methylation domain-containing protein/prepilin-type processing-associated H-X9-DG protein
MQTGYQSRRVERDAEGECAVASSCGSSPVAFTLVELLVVIAIISLLAGLLLPVLGKAKATAQSIGCTSHLRQVQFAWVLYCSDHEGRVPLIVNSGAGGYSRSLEGSWVVGNAKRDRSEDGLQGGSLWSYLSAAVIYRCPADRSTVMGHPELRRFRSYALNGWLGWKPAADAGVGVATIGNVYRDAELREPACTFGFLDVSEDSIEAGDMSIAIDADAQYRSVVPLWMHHPAWRHRGGAEISFLDGHAESHRWEQSPKTQGATIWPAAGELDRRDLQWLFERTPFFHRWRERR